MLAWSPLCLARCLCSEFSPVISCSMFQEETANLADVPEAYHDFQAVDNNMLIDMVERFVLVYLDNILIFSRITSAIMSGECSSDYLRIVYSPGWRSASFTHGRFRSWDLSSLPRVSSI